MKGLVVKGIGGFYYVQVDEVIYECKARGILKKNKNKVAVGDIVDILVAEGEETVITKIYPRKNSFIRPPVANIDCFLVTFSVDMPKPNFLTIDKFLVMAEKSNTEVIMCVTKVDLSTKRTVLEELNKIKDIYENIYDIVFLSSETGEGLEELKSKIKGKTCAFAGPSGVGKTSLINALQPDMKLETGMISKKTERGKHTTRHVEIFNTNFGSRICDTPGFTSFEILEAEEDELAELYPEIEKLIGSCKYGDCKHLKEPDCAVLEAVEKGIISKSRYNSYVSHLEEIRERDKKW